MRLIFSCAFVLLICAAAQAAPMAKGTVYHDENGNGKRDRGEAGIPGVGVSNGRDVVETDAEGRYAVAARAGHAIFVIKPSGWRFPLDPDTRLPRFHHAYHPEGSPKLKHPGVAPTGRLPRAVDFALLPADESRPLRMICLGDTQPRDQREIDYIGHDIIEELLGVEADFGVTLGDLVFDDLGVLDAYANAVGVLNLPWLHVVGNHDINFDAPDRAATTATFERIFGPPHYAATHGKTHLLVLNNIHWVTAENKYHAELGADQLAFIENSLARVPEDHLVVAMLHIPIVDMVDRDAFFALLSRFPHNFSLSAHWHRQESFFFGPEEGWHGAAPHHHLVHGTASGSWWGGFLDETGIPHTTMSDGTPNGYSIITFDGNRYDVTYKVARRPADYQMNIWAPEAVPASDTAAEVVVNVFAGTEHDRVEMRVDGTEAWMPLAHAPGVDPYIQEIWARQLRLYTHVAQKGGAETVDENLLKATARELQDLVGRGVPQPKDTKHLWRGTLPAGLPAGYHLLQVRTVDRYGKEHAGRRVFRVE
jgi:hypothetical protein